MLSQNLKINLSNPFWGLFPLLILMLTDTLFGKVVAYSVGTITAIVLNCCLYFFQRERFKTWYIYFFCCFLIFSFFLYDFIDDKFRFIRSELLVAAYFALLLLLKKPLKYSLLEGKYKMFLGFRENINAIFLLMKNILIFLLFYISCYFISKNFGTFGENEKEIYQVIEWGILFIILIIATTQIRLYRIYFNDEKYVAIINENENVIGYESFNLLVGKRKMSDEKNRHIVVRVMAIFEGKLMLKRENGIWDLYYQDYLLYGENYELCLKRIVGENNFFGVKMDEKYSYVTDKEIRITLLHTLMMNSVDIEALDPSTYKLWTIDQLRSELGTSIFKSQLKRDLDVHLTRLEAAFTISSDI